MRDGAISSKFSIHRVSKECNLCNFQKLSPSPKMAAILNFRIFAKNGKTQICFYLLNRARYRAISSKFSTHRDGPQWQSGNTLASHLCGRGSIPVMAVSGKAGSCLPLVGSLQYRTLANYMYWFPLPFQLPVLI